MNRQRRVKALGGSGGGSPSYAYLPLTITFDGELSDATPDFDVAAALGSVLLGDTLRFQQANNSGFTTNLLEVDTVITQAMIDNINVTPSGLLVSLDGATYWRAVMLRGGNPIMDWSNTQSGVMDVPPTITTSSTASVAENATLSISLTANQTSTFSIVGGADSAKFEISGTTLRFASNATKDFENPDDADANNAYVVTVRATAIADSQTGDKTITATVTDVSEASDATFIAMYTDGSNVSGATYHRLGVSIGAAASDRLVVICGANDFGNQALVSGKINGNAATVIESAGAGNGAGTWMMQLAVPTGTTADIEWTTNNAHGAGKIAVYTLSGLNSMTPITHNKGFSTTTPLTFDLNTTAGCAIIAVGSSIGSSPIFSGDETYTIDSTSGAEFWGHKGNASLNSGNTLSIAFGGGGATALSAAAWK